MHKILAYPKMQIFYCLGEEYKFLLLIATLNAILRFFSQPTNTPFHLWKCQTLNAQN